MKQQKWLNLLLALAFPCTASLAQPVAGPGSDLPPAQPASPAEVALPPAAAEVVRLSEGGATEDVILSYVHDSSSRFNLSADQILYLRDIGCSPAVISAMLNRDHELQAQNAVYNYDQRLYPSANPGAVAPQPSSAPEPQEQPPAPPATVPEAPPPSYVSTPPPDVAYFYDDLSPYGSWVDVDGLGWCWQPRVVVINHGWRPYCDGGYWVYSDAGWYWQSTYSWGWAPFHYGRWHLHPRCGWVWMPDRVWGPSWVVWRSEGGYCGWAPLPPHAVFEVGVGWRFNGISVAVGFDFGLRPDHYTFIAMRDFDNHDLGHHRLAPTEVTHIYNNTTIINNYTVNNNRIVNQGIKVDRVAAATHTQIRPVAIRDVPAGSHTAAMPAAGRTGSVLYRPQLSAPAHRATMLAQKVDDRHPVIQHTPVPAAPTRTASSAVRDPFARGNSSRTPQPSYGQAQQHAAPERPAYRQDNAGRGYQTTPNSSAQPYPHAPNANTTRSEPPRSYSAPQRSGNEPGNWQPRSARPQPESYSPGAYYPKSYEQASEIHSLPPQNSRPDYSNGSQRETSNGHSHKN